MWCASSSLIALALVAHAEPPAHPHALRGAAEHPVVQDLPAVGPRCDYDALPFSFDLRTYSPPLWRYNATRGECMAIDQGSGSWQEYAYGSRAECAAACIAGSSDAGVTRAAVAAGPTIPGASAAEGSVGGDGGAAAQDLIATKPRCNYDMLPFTRDHRTYSPPLWRNDAARNECVAVAEGSGSWQLYAYVSRAECAAACTVSSDAAATRATATADPAAQGVSAVERSAGVSGGATTEAGRIPQGNLHAKDSIAAEPRCNYDTLPFTSDYRTYSPPLWRKDAALNECVAVAEGSGSWQLYAFVSRAECAAACTVHSSDAAVARATLTADPAAQGASAAGGATTEAGRMPRGDLDAKELPAPGSRCDYDALPFSRDLQTYSPPLWRYDAALKACVAVAEGSGSWQLYAFADSAECSAACVASSSTPGPAARGAATAEGSAVAAGGR
mmetsp:Transcript_93552/g.302335  ORF Transcript_93552/g.302335 Transcript_93552/m.302335 type:complete len:445 (+) Transcript_93552:99-1433(+)